MTLKSFLLIVVGILSAGLVNAQQAEELVFTEKNFDFGTVKEQDGPITHEFSFINKGMKPVKILGVKASCGCTTPDWSKEEIKPGETGFIQAQYNPRNRPGPFNKSLTVTTDASGTPLRLYIKGNVVPQPKSVEDELPTAMGALRVKYRSFNIGKVKTTDEPTVKEFDVYNMSETPVTFIEEQQVPAHIKLEFEPRELPAASKGVIRIIYDGKAKNDLGFSSDNVVFFTDEEGENAAKSISVYATIEEFFPPMTKEELEKAPQLKIDKSIHDFGKIKENQSVSTKFTLTNTGASPLIIRQTKSNCSCTLAKTGKETLQPGESTDLEVTFNSEGRRGNQQKSVTVFSNDPRAAAQRVTVKTYVDVAE